MVSAARRPSALMTMADYYGTLAAVRSLGRSGIPVHIAEWRLLVPARWSRYAAATRSCPDLEAHPTRFVEWLLDLGRRRPGQVLLPTSDGVAWLLAVHREELGRHFLLDVPPAATVYTLLNKWRLSAACAAAGLATPWTALPADDRELEALVRTVPFPLMVKPQTQVGLWPHQKGRIVESPAELVTLYSDLCAATQVRPELLAIDPGAARPVLQAFAASGAEGIYSLSGFSDLATRTLVAQASRKILQRPRRLGVGLCFEEADVLPALHDGVERLCRQVGYQGVFEVEFLEVAGRHLLIDFNPRFFGEMAFDVDRGLDLPLLAYLSAAGDRAGLEVALAEAASASGGRGGRVFCNRVQLGSQLALQRVAGSARGGEAARWREWLLHHRGRVTDPSLDGTDWLPGLVDVLREVKALASHPRSAWRNARRG